MKIKMHNDLLDLKVSLLTGVFLFISFSNVEIIMKVIIFLITAGYTIDRWIHLRKNKKE